MVLDWTKWQRESQQFGGHFDWTLSPEYGWNFHITKFYETHFVQMHFAICLFCPQLCYWFKFWLSVWCWSPQMYYFLWNPCFVKRKVYYFSSYFFYSCYLMVALRKCSGGCFLIDNNTNLVNPGWYYYHYVDIGCGNYNLSSFFVLNSGTIDMDSNYFRIINLR